MSDRVHLFPLHFTYQMHVGGTLRVATFGRKEMVYGRFNSRGYTPVMQLADDLTHAIGVRPSMDVLHFENDIELFCERLSERRYDIVLTLPSEYRGPSPAEWARRRGIFVREYLFAA